MEEVDFKEKPWSLYVLRCVDDSFYCGISNDVDKRLETHNKGLGSKYVKSRLPARLIFSQLIGSKSDALKAEIYFKKKTRKQKKEIINSGKIYRD